ncbi:MAG: DUF2179 domain-containing protein [Porphyromonadaceae bacterium]|nr:MAG: DUF2179 domain-containing protein [Porphyromonadaceae bacterium]
MPFDFWGIIVVPILIFLARIGDVSIGTVRIIFVSKGYRYLAPLLGFFEVFIWLMAMTKILQNLDRWYYYFAYCGGFATGNFIGIILEEKIAIGYTAVRVISRVPADDLIKQLQDAGYGVTYDTAEGSTGTVEVIYTIIKRSELQAMISLINQFNPKAFYTVEDVKAVSEGIHRFTNYQKNVLFKRGRMGK